MLNTNAYIDVWPILEDIFNRKKTIDVLAFLTMYAYGSTLKRTSSLLNLKPGYIKKSNSAISKDIQRTFSRKKINVNTISNLIGVKRAIENKKDTNSDSEVY